MKRKCLSLLLALTLILGLAATVSADEGFVTSGDWTYAYNADGHLMLVKYLGTDTHVTVPAEIDGQKVHTLGYTLSCPFSGVRETLTSVTIEPGIQFIEAQAFKGCTALTEADIPDTVTHISAYVFEGCTALESIEIPGSVQRIGFDSFRNCTKLAQVHLNEGTLTIGDSAFRNTALTSITVPASVVFIDQHALGYCDKPENNGALEGFAIYGYTGSEAARYARDCGYFVFYDLAGLTDVSGMCGDSAAWYFDETDGTLYISGEGATENYRNGPAPWVHHAEGITRVIVGEGIKYLGESTFADHYPNLREVSLPSTLISIENRCFENCTGLSGIVIPEKTTWIGGGVFRNSGLEWILLPHSTATYGNEIGNALADCPRLSNVVFAGDAWVMASRTFENSTLTAWYPAGNPTWTASVMQNYGGSVTWKPYDGLDFIDVLPFQFWYEPVSWAVEQEVTTGISATEFGPGGSCNRAQVVTFLWRAAGSPEPAVTENPFVDVEPGSFFEKAVLWAVEEGITTGTDASHFSPGLTCNRATVVTFLYRAFGEPAVESSSNPFQDVPAGGWYTAPILWAVEQNITNGVSADSFAPGQNCSRAQIVTFLFRAYVN